VDILPAPVLPLRAATPVGIPVTQTLSSGSPSVATTASQTVPPGDDDVEFEIEGSTLLIGLAVVGAILIFK
jgi:hypothetical protein